MRLAVRLPPCCSRPIDRSTGAGSPGRSSIVPEGKHIKSITRGRFNQFIGGHYSDKNLTNHLFVTSTDSTANVKLSVWSPKAGEKPSFEEAKGQKYKPAKKGDSFGPSCE